MNDLNAVSLLDNPHTQKTFKATTTIYKSSTNVNVGLPVVDHFQQPETSSQPLLSEIDNETQKLKHR